LNLFTLIARRRHKKLRTDVLYCIHLERERDIESEVNHVIGWWCERKREIGDKMRCWMSFVEYGVSKYRCWTKHCCIIRSPSFHLSNVSPDTYYFCQNEYCMPSRWLVKVLYLISVIIETSVIYSHNAN
jgi:hypothetical protein